MKPLIISIIIVTLFLSYGYEALGNELYYTYADEKSHPHGHVDIITIQGKPVIRFYITNSSTKHLNFNTAEVYAYDELENVFKLRFIRDDFFTHPEGDRGILKPQHVIMVYAYYPPGLNSLKELFVEFSSGEQLHFVTYDEHFKRTSPIRYRIERLFKK